MFTRSNRLDGNYAVHPHAAAGDVYSPSLDDPLAGSSEPTTRPPPAPPAGPRQGDTAKRGRATSTGARDDQYDERDRKSILRVPTFSPLAPLLGWLAAWGAIAAATAILERVGVPTGINLGIANGGPGDDGLWAGIWELVVSGGGFVLGGYAAARIARVRGTRHAVLVWVVAMAATAADAVIDALRYGSEGVVRLIVGVPFWSDTGLTSDAKAVVVLVVFAGVSLAGAIIGGSLGQAANRIDRTDNAVVVRS